MNYLKLAALIAAFLLGGAASYYVIARPEISNREAEISRLHAQSAQNQATFEAAVAAKQKELEHERATQDAAYAAVVRDKDADIARVLAAGAGLQHDIDAYLRADNDRRLSDAPGAVCAADDAATALGHLLEGAADLAAKRTADAERLADQVRGLQDAIKGTP